MIADNEGVVDLGALVRLAADNVLKMDDVLTWRVDCSTVLDAKGKVPLSLNQRGSWQAYASVIARTKARTRQALMDAQVPLLRRVHVELIYRPATNRFRDVDNIVATLKPMIDAMHQPVKPDDPMALFWTPIVPTDDGRYVSWSQPWLEPWVKGQPAGLWLVLSAHQSAVV